MSGSKIDATIVIIGEDWKLSIARDSVTFGGLLACVGVGVWVDSIALQWIGGIMWILGILGRIRHIIDKNRKTPQEAANWLRDKYNVTAR